ncbi:MAG: GntR family transcriptional regulator [Planctomycetes bacterium]|nr:GntR family transcriptional regulator [Planctomycetota bacterium]
MRLPQRIPRETARDYAIRTLRQNIVTMDLEPGCMVSENELAQEMGLSRTPVREALIELSKSGIVEIYPQHGSMIARIDYDKVEEASFTRRVLETAVVREACRFAGPDDLRALDENLAFQRLYLANGDTEKLLAVDNEFHRLLFSIAKKTLSFELMRSLSTHFDRVRQLSLIVLREVRIVEDHQAIADAIRTGDGDLAAAAMHRHLTRYQLDKDAIREKYARYFVA